MVMHNLYVSKYSINNWLRTGLIAFIADLLAVNRKLIEEIQKN